MGKYSDHSTYNNKEGMEVPSVTTILKVLNKPFIAKWANSLGWKRQSYDKVLEESAERGTFVHELLHEYLFKEGKRFDISHPDTVNFIAEHINAFKEFLSEHELEPIWGEKSFSVEQYGGTIDLLCNLDNELTILDFKTSKRFYSSHFIQLGAYIQLLEAHDIFPAQVGICRIRDGKVELKLIKREDMIDYIDLFNSLLNTFYMVYELNKEWGDML
jgi:hypothetical protein